MKIEIETCRLPDFAQVRIDGRLAADIQFGQMVEMTQKDDELKRLRPYKVFFSNLKDYAEHLQKLKDAELKQFFNGYADGLIEKTIPFPTDDNVPPILTNYNSNFEAGYNLARFFVNLQNSSD